MGRHRKKKSSRKQSLLFEESPKESRQHPLSPVICVDNPVTAVPVPIDGKNNISWVSPHFNGITAAHGRHRQARRRHRSIGNNQSRVTFNKENSNVGRCTTRCRSGTHKKFPALAFVSDPSKSTRNTRRLKSTGAGGLSEQLGKESISLPSEEAERKRRCKNRCVSSNGEGGEEDDGCVERVERMHSSIRRFRNQNHFHSPAQCSAICSDDSSLSSLPSPDLSSTLSVKVNVAKGVSRPLTRSCSASKTSQTKNQRCVSPSEVNTNRRKSYNSDILVSPLEPANLTQPYGPSTLFPSVPREPLPLAIALFAQNLSANASFNSSGCSSPKSGLESQDDSVDSAIRRPVLSGKKSSCWGEVKRRGTPTEQRRHGQSSQSFSQEPTPRRSKRLQDKYREALKYLHPETPIARKSTLPECHVKTLVTDTPENEYHLTVRQRQRLRVARQV